MNYFVFLLLYNNHFILKENLKLIKTINHLIALNLNYFKNLILQF
jgi:hypothetical protein